MKNILKQLLAVFFLLLFVGCDAKIPASNIVPKEIDEVEEVEEINFYGKIFRLYMDENCGYEAGGVFSDLVRERFNQIKTEYDCDVTFTDERLYDIIAKNVANNEDFCDISVASSYGLYSEIKSGYFLPIDEFTEGIDYTDSKKWGTANMLVDFVVNGHLYGVLPYNWPGASFLQSSIFLFANEKMITELNQPDPREYIENGQWTTDKLTELTDLYTHSDGDGNTVYALAASIPHYMSMAFHTAGIDYVIKNSDGSYSSAFDTPEALETADEAMSYLKNRAGVSIFCDPDAFNIINCFAENHSVMLLSNIYYTLDAIQYTMENYAVLPFPLSGNMTGGEFVTTQEFFHNGLVIPVTCSEPDVVSVFADLLYSPLPGYENDADIKAYYETNLFYDDRDATWVLEAVKNSRYIPYNDGGYLIAAAFGKDYADKSVNQILEENKDAFQGYIESYYIPAQEWMDKLFR